MTKARSSAAANTSRHRRKRRGKRQLGIDNDIDALSHALTACSPPVSNAAAASTVRIRVSSARGACLRELEKTPTAIGKLAFLASLQSQLASDHQELFADWLGLSIHQQYEAMRDYLEGSSAVLERSSEVLRPEGYTLLVPLGASDVDKMTFEANLEMVLSIVELEREPTCIT